MNKRGLYRRAVSVRPSVCLFVTFVYSIKTNKHIFQFFFHPEYLYVHSSYSTTNVMVILWRKPPHGGVESRWDTGVWKNRYFRPVSRCIASCQCCNRQLLSTRCCLQTVLSSSHSSHSLVAVSGGVCWWLETTIEVCMTRSLNVTPKQQNSI